MFTNRTLWPFSLFVWSVLLLPPATLISGLSINTPLSVEVQTKYKYVQVKHQRPNLIGENIPYQPLLIKPIFSLLANAEKQTVFFPKLVFQCLGTKHTDLSVWLTRHSYIHTHSCWSGFRSASRSDHWSKSRLMTAVDFFQIIVTDQVWNF